MSVRRGFPGSVPGAAAAPAPSPAAIGARLANGLRGLMGKAQALCRLRRISADVQLHEHIGAQSARLSYSGVATCKSSLCPLCAPKWQGTRVQEVVQAVQQWQGQAERDWRDGGVYGPRRDRTPGRRVAFATLTMKHNPGMPLVLQHRLLARAFGHLWSGRAGQALVKKLGGKPESVRAHDRTWSHELGWHPHLHALLFCQHDLTPDLEQELFNRWAGGSVYGPRRRGVRRDPPGALVSALRAMKRFCAKTLARAEELEQDPGVCWRGWCNAFAGRELRSCPCLRCTSERARRMFGRLVPRLDLKDPWAANALIDSVQRVSDLLERFTEESITPLRSARGDESWGGGVQCEPVRGTDEAPKYLAKLGLELAWHESKSVNVVRGVARYPYWAVAHLATQHGNPLRVPARRAWKQLFEAVRGTQAIVFSDREALGLGPDPYAANQEPEEQQPGEFTRLLGIIHGATWDSLRKQYKQQGHGLLATITAAYEAGVLPELPWVAPPPGWSGVPSTRGPPPAAYVPLEVRQRRIRFDARIQRGRDWTAQVLERGQRERQPEHVWSEEFRQKLLDAGVRLHTPWRRPWGEPW